MLDKRGVTDAHKEEVTEGEKGESGSARIQQPRCLELFLITLEINNS